MCGICGTLTTQEEVPHQDLLEAINRAMSHRGPDSEGYYLHKHVGLAMRRLSIIDLEGGKQPISNEDGSIVVVLNGEIYNYLELTQKLRDKGHIFQTKSDTETLVHLYEEYGDNLVHHLRGMFAFALWDQNKKKLILGRDRLGKKPLNYYLDSKRLVFCSEIAPLLKDTSISREMDSDSLLEYLSQGYINAPRTIYRHVRKLPPASIGIWEDGQLQIKKYWELDFSSKTAQSSEEIALQFATLLDESIRLRFRSDVPVGLLLSGGLDSSAILARCTLHLSQPVNTFTIGFEDKEYDESTTAAKIAQHFGVPHHRLQATQDTLLNTDKMALHYGEPFADKSALPSFLLCEMTAKHVKVALNGDGGDECLAGYGKYRISPLQRLGRGLVSPTVAEQLLLHASVHSEGLSRGLRKYLLPDAASLLSSEFFAGRHLSSIWKGDFSENYLSEKSREIGCFFNRKSDLIDRMLWQDYNHYLPGDLLAKMDIASMAYGVEVRSPFLDQELVSYSASLPASLKVNGKMGKLLLRKLIAPDLPQEILSLPKKGFSVPLATWFRQKLGTTLENHLENPPDNLRSHINFHYARKLLNEHRSQKKNHAQRLWNLFMLLKWSQNLI